MKKRIIVLFAITLFALSTSVYAKGASVGVKAPRSAPAWRVRFAISDSIALRAGVNYFPYTYNGTAGDIDYDFDLNLISVPVLIDYHPFKGSFRLSGGAIYNGNNLDAKATPVADTVIGGIPFTPAQIGTLNADIDFSPIAPYLGLGWDTSFGKESGFGFTFELGALFQGEPEANLSSTGLLSADAHLSGRTGERGEGPRRRPK